ncbi:MAG: DUF2306 domain-containing protein [Hyphomicrobiaceae bacterium]
MDVAPLLNAPGIIQVHAFCAIGALLLGSVQLVRHKGGAAHRIIGYAWVALMLVIAISSFWIHEIDQWNGFSLIHLLSILVLISVPMAVHAVRRGNIGRHRSSMISLFWTALVITGLFTLMPGRILHRVLFG